MLVDLLSPANYLMINKDAVKKFGLIPAVYCSELLTIYKKVVTKKKFVTDDFFEVDREYIRKQTSIEPTEQLKCDEHLEKAGILKISKDNSNIIEFNVEIFSSLLAEEDVKILKEVKSTMRGKTSKTKAELNREYHINKLKESIICNTPKVLYAMRDWIDSLMANPQKYLSEQQVKIFKNRLDEYCNGDLDKALKIIEIATIRQYVDCDWAINVLETNNKLVRNNTLNVRTTEQKKTTIDQLGEEIF